MIRRLAAASAALIVFSELCACSHGGTLACEPTSRYAAASSDGPVRIPDDLNPPDETESLRVPADPGRGAAPQGKGCLETPPGFYADGAPNNPRGGQGPRRGGAAAASPRQAAPPPTAVPPPAATPPAAAPAPASAPAPGADQTPPVATPAPSTTDTPPPGGDREITN